MSLYKGNNLISGAMPNSANQSLSNLDSAGQDKFDEKVNKAGDTMTGDLIIQKATGGAEVKLRHPEFTKGTNPSGNIYWEYKAEDNNINPAEWYTNRVSNLVTTVSSSGTVDVAMIAYKNDPNSSASASIRATITSAGVASCSFPNTTCCDGQWVKKNLTVANNVTTSASNVTYSLSSYLPNDGHVYEILMTGYALASESGKFSKLDISSDLLDGLILIQTRARTNALYDSGGSGIIPVGTGRYIRWNTSSSANFGGTYTLNLRGYRRIGTNS